MAFEAGRVEIGEGRTQVQQVTQGQAVVQDGRPGDRLYQVVADDHRAGPVGDHPLHGQDQEVLLASVPLQVVPDAYPLPGAVDEQLGLAAPHEREGRPTVEEGAAGFGHVEARCEVADRIREPEGDAADLVHDVLEAEEVDDDEVVDRYAEYVGHCFDERRGAEFHAADQQGRGQLLLPDRYAVAVDHHVEVAGQRHQRCA